MKDNVIQWAGRTEDLPQEFSTADEVLSMKDTVVIPGMVLKLTRPSVHACDLRISDPISIAIVPRRPSAIP